MATAETPPEAAMLELAAVFFLPRRWALKKVYRVTWIPSPIARLMIHHRYSMNWTLAKYQSEVSVFIPKYIPTIAKEASTPSI